MTKESYRIITSAAVAAILILMLVGSATQDQSNTLYFNVTFTNAEGNTVTLNHTNPTGSPANSNTLAGNSSVALNFTIKDTQNTTTFYNITFDSTKAGLSVSGASVSNNTGGTHIIGTNFVNLSGTSVTAGNETYINISNITVPQVTNSSEPNQLTINLTTGFYNSDPGIGYGYGTPTLPSQLTITLTFDIVSGVNGTQSSLTNVSISKVANNTDKFMMNLTAKDAYGNVINGATFNLKSNRTQDVFDPSSVTTNATGQAVFNVTSTLAGVALITANGTNLGNANLTNDKVVFISGPAAKLAIFGPDSVTGITTLNQTVAVQDA